MAEKEISLNHLTKIEGHASLNLSIKDGNVEKCELSSIEGSRYFEGLLKGRKYLEASEISSRICGICSCAHTVCSIMAMENALNLKVPKQTHDLRKLLMIGERIRSHATHLYFLALPDYLGYESAMQMLPKYKREVQRALRMMQIGNEIVRVVGGRDMHPVAATIGGFTALPKNDDMHRLLKELESIKPFAKAAAELFAGLQYPEFQNETMYLSLHNIYVYPILNGSIKTPDKTFRQSEFHRFISEYHEPNCTANFALKEGKSYFTGALARINNNLASLSEDSAKIITDSGISFPNNNPFLNNFCQAVELVHCIDHAIILCKELHAIRDEKPVPAVLRKCHGIAAIEVPRGVLWHEYELDDDGKIVMANIVTPTSQNLRRMRDDIKALVPALLEKTKNRDRIVLEIEKLIRAYDPCFSCSTHFVQVRWE